MSTPLAAVVLALTSLATAGPADAEPLFLDVTAASGIEFVHERGDEGRRYLPETMGAGVAVLDYDGDGRLDVYLVQSGPIAGPPAAGNRLYRNLGAGRFEDVTDRTGAAGPAGYGQGAVAGDVDGDGWTDLYLTRFGPNVLLRNRGDGTFVDATAPAGVGDAAWSSSAVFFDPDGDGDLDLYVVDYLDYTLATHRDCRHGEDGALFYCHPDTYPSAPDVFYQNRGDGTFEDATARAGIADRDGKGLGAVAADLDGDGRSDLYVTNDSTPNFLFLNRGLDEAGTLRFEENGLFAGVAFNGDGETEAGMGVDAGDVDGDGRLDLMVTNLSLESNALYLGGEGLFTYATPRAGLHAASLPVLGFGTDLLDVDRDGDLDLLVINGDLHDDIARFNDGLSWRQPSQVFLNDGTGRFSPAAPSSLGGLEVPRVGRGSATADLDDDGRLDLVVSFSDDRARLFTGLGGGAWIGFALPGAGGIGARVVVDVGGKRQLEEVRAGSSYQSSGDPRLCFGLGVAPASSSPDEVAIRWTGEVQRRYRGLRPGAYYRIAAPPAVSRSTSVAP